MIRLNWFSFFMYSFFILFALSFFRAGFDDMQILLLSGAIVTLSFLAIGFDFLYKKETVSINAIITLILCWFLSVSLPIAFNWVQSTAQYGLFQCSVWVFAFLIITYGQNQVQSWHQFKKLICILGFIFSIWAMSQQYIFQEMATGPFGTRNSNGAFLMLAALILGSELLHDKKLLEHQIIADYKVVSYLMLFFIVNLGLLLSFSRGVYLSYGISLLFLFMVNANRARAKNIIILSMIILLSAIVLYASAWDSIQHRLDVLAQEKSRLIIWKGAWHLWRESPWYGIGIENFKYFYHAFSLPGDGSTLENAHNDYLQLLIETGIPGITLLFALLCSFVYCCIQYLRNPSTSFGSHKTITTQIAMVSSLAMYSCVDFIFYIFSFNILLGVLLGFLYRHLDKEGHIRHFIITSKLDYQKILSIPLVLVFLFVVSLFSSLLRYSFYNNQATEYINQGRLSEAALSYKYAKRYFDSPYVYNNLVSLYLEQAKNTKDTTDKVKLIAKAEHVIDLAIALYPYNAEPYFQQGIINALYYNNNAKAQIAFETHLRLKPQANFERLTFCYFLLEQDQFFYAQEILEKGLLYPIYANYAPKYLELLANLRVKNGDKIGAQQIVEAVSHIETYSSDFSALTVHT